MDIRGDMPLLIRQHLASVWALEILLQLRRQPERLWTVDELVAALRATSTLVSNNLKSLETSGLTVVEDGRHRYGPASSLLSAFADQVDAMYRERPVTVINLISAPADRLQALADAFKFRGDR